MSTVELKPLRFTTSDELCPPVRREGLRVNITEVLGTAAKVKAGGRYVVKGSYERTDTVVAKLCLAGHGLTSGTNADASAASGSFELAAEPQKVEAGKEGIFDLLMLDAAGVELGVRLRVRLAPAAK